MIVKGLQSISEVSVNVRNKKSVLKMSQVFSHLLSFVSIFSVSFKTKSLISTSCLSVRGECF